jgi:hypothetical protein
MSNPLKRIHDLFEQGKKPTSLTEKEREVLNSSFEDRVAGSFKFKSFIRQTKKETPTQALTRLEKSIAKAIKEAKSYLAKSKISDVDITLLFFRESPSIEVEGSRPLTDKILIEEEFKRWKWESKIQSKQQEEERSFSELKEQNALLKQLVSQLKKGSKTAK